MAGDRTLELDRAEDGGWIVDGRARPDLAPCRDIDIMVTPFTNSLPIRRLAWVPDAVQVIEAAYIRLPDRFRYRNLASGFTAELAVDGDGLVLDYPGVWRRR